jgi:hypothetical protein
LVQQQRQIAALPGRRRDPPEPGKQRLHLIAGVAEEFAQQAALLEGIEMNAAVIR